MVCLPRWFCFNLMVAGWSPGGAWLRLRWFVLSPRWLVLGLLWLVLSPMWLVLSLKGLVSGQDGLFNLMVVC